MKSFARLESGSVVERLDVEDLPPFHAALLWIECDPVVRVGWLENDGALVPSPDPEASAFELAVVGRAWRDATIESIKWLRERHRDQLELGLTTTLEAVQFKELLVHMQALRDWPQSPTFPETQSRPTSPVWIAEQLD